MGHPYLFIAVGIVAAATALIVWLNSEDRQPTRHRQRQPSHYECNENSSNRDHVRQRPCNLPEPDKECMICCEKTVEAKFIPCQHACMCEDCVMTFMRLQDENGYTKRCPYCRGNIRRFEKI